MKTNDAYRPRDLRKLAQITVVLVVLYALSCVLNAAGTGLEMSALAQLNSDMLLGGYDPVPGVSGAAELVIGLSAAACVLMFLVSGTFVLVWVYRTNVNAKVLAADKPMSPGWAVGWYFVPVAWLWKPFQGMRESWQISTKPMNWRDVPVSSLLHNWWAAWLAGNILDSISFRVAHSATTVAKVWLADTFDVCGSFFDVVCALLLILIIRQLTTRQTTALAAAGSIENNP
jgi:hypothetical protein